MWVLADVGEESVGKTRLWILFNSVWRRRARSTGGWKEVLMQAEVADYHYICVIKSDSNLYLLQESK